MVEENCAQKEGEEPLDDEAKTHLHKKMRFKLQTRGFYAPHEPKPPKKKKAVLKEEHHKPEPLPKDAKPAQATSGLASKNETIESTHAD